MAQDGVALGAAYEGGVLGVLGDFQADDVAGGTFKSEAMMPHASGPQPYIERRQAGQYL
jgi:hypothetical protein